MKDHFGVELRVGEQVTRIAAYHSTFSAYHGYVVGFTPQKVKFSEEPDGKGTAISPHSLIVRYT